MLSYRALLPFLLGLAIAAASASFAIQVTETQPVPAASVTSFRVEMPEETPRSVLNELIAHGWTAGGDETCECMYGDALGVYDVPGGFLVVFDDTTALYVPEFNGDV